jgi:hypothetical protein
VSTCRSCGAAITWARTAGGKAIPLNPEPVLGGNVELVETGAHVVACVVTPDAGVARHTSHFANCPQANSHRKERRR